MLSNDHGASAEPRPGDQPLPDATGDRPAPAPTGLIELPELPVPPPVPFAPQERRRGWAFTASLVLVTVMGGAALFMSGYTVGRDSGLTPPGEASEADAWKPFWSAYTFIRDRYPLEPIERDTLIEGAIRGMVESVGDPYSSYLSPEDFETTLNDISGTFEGIGAEIGAVDVAGNAADCATFGPDCHLVVIAPLAGSPAEAAGLRPGDVIATVDGATLDGLTPDEARDRVRGKAGTEVVLHVLRFEAPIPAPTAAPGASPAGSAAPASTPEPRELLDEFDVTIVRAKIQRREVTSRELAGGTVGYVSLSGFSSEGAKQLEDAIRAHLDNGITKIVFDLRGNPGGFVTDAEAVASEFLADGPIYFQEEADGTQTEVDASARRHRDRPVDRGRRPHRPRVRLGERAGRGSAPGPRPRDARRRDVVRQGHGPAMAPARQARRRQADGLEVAHAEQALDPSDWHHPGRRDHDFRGHPCGR